MALPTVIVGTLTDPALSAPVAVAADVGRGRLLVARPLANRIAWLDPAVAVPVVITFGLAGTDPAAEGLSGPLAVAVEATGNVVVLDSGNGELDHYLYSAGGGGTYTYDPGFLGGARSSLAGLSLSQPTDLALMGSLLYVLDAGNGRVVTVDLGTGLSQAPIADPSWSQPNGVAVSGTGEILVADTFNHRVLKYPAGPGAPTVIGGYGTTLGQLRLPHGLALDGAGNLFVADSGNQRVQVFDPAGLPLGAIGDASVFGSIRGLAFDPAGRLVVADAARNTVTIFAAAPAGPILRLDGTVFEFGSVGVGYALDRPLAIHNDGSAPLHVTAVASSSSRFVPAATSFVIAPGGVNPLIVRFSPSAPGFETGTLTLTSDSVTGVNGGIVLRGTGITPPLVDAALVLDRSGSMSQSIGSQSKMAALQSAAHLFVDLMRAGLGDRVGIVDFDNLATTDLAVTPVTDVAPSSRVAAHTAINALGPRGSTSIGGGMEQARAAFTAAGPGSGRQVMVVVTDGMENTAPFVKGGQATDPHVDLTLYAGMTIYTVGLGLGTEVDLGVLASLASSFRGAFYLTEDRWFALPKFFLEIFGDTLAEFVTLDPEFTLNGPAPTEVTIDLDRADTTVTFGLYWQDPQLDLDLEVVTPRGTVIGPGVTASHSEIRFARGRGYAFFRMGLPLAASLGRGWAGTWTVRVSAPKLAKEARAAFGLSVLVASNLGFHCELVRESDSTGASVAFDARLTDYGRAIRPDSIHFHLDQPAFGRGQLLSELKEGRGEKVSPDYATDVVRDRLAFAVRNDPRFRARQVRELPVRLEHKEGGVVARALLPQAAIEGGYHYRFVAELRRGGLCIRRECGHAFVAIAYPDRGRSSMRLDGLGTKQRRARYQLTFTPTDVLGQLLGPGLVGGMKVTANGASVGKVSDAGDGSYAVDVAVAPGREESVKIEWRLRDRRLHWTWAELTGGGDPPPRRPKAVGPRIWPTD